MMTCRRKIIQPHIMYKQHETGPKVLHLPPCSKLHWACTRNITDITKVPSAPLNRHGMVIDNHGIYLDITFWFVCIPFDRMVEFQSLAQFPVDHLSYQSYLVFYSFCASLMHSLIMYLPTLPCVQDVTQGQFLAKVNRFEFRVFLLPDWFPYQSQRA